MELNDSTPNPSEDLLNAVRRAMGNQDTRALVRWVLTISGTLDPSYTGDSEATHFNEGKRHVGLSVVALLDQIDPYEFVRLMKEAVDEGVLRRVNEDKEMTYDD